MECREGGWDVTEQEERPTVTQAEPPCVSEMFLMSGAGTGTGHPQNPAGPALASFSE